MKQEFAEELPKEVFERTKIQTLVLFCFAVVMIFAGFISGYVVQSSGDRVWVKLIPPTAFLYSTIAVVAGSLFLFLAKFLAKRDNKPGITICLGLALVSGLSFGYFQFQGWKQLVSGGNLVAVHILNEYGRYGEYFYFAKDGERIEHNGQDYLLNDSIMPEDEVAKLKAMAADLCDRKWSFAQAEGKIQMDNSWEPYQIVSVKKGTVNFQQSVQQSVQQWENGDVLNVSEKQNLFEFGLAVHLGMEYFKLTGTYGEDFAFILNKEELEFENKKFYYPKLVLTEDEIAGVEATAFIEGREIVVKDGKLTTTDGNPVDVSKGEFMFEYRAGKVDFPIVIKDGVWTRLRTEISDDDYGKMREDKNNTSAYFWVVTLVHFAHIIGGMIYLIVLFRLALNKRFSSDNHLKIKLGGLYWHVLGGLWLFLFFFFQYYH